MGKAGASPAERGMWWWRAPRPRRLRRRRRPRVGMPWEWRRPWEWRAAKLRVKLTARSRLEREQARARIQAREQERERARIQERERARAMKTVERKQEELERRELHVAVRGRQLEKEHDSLTWKTILVWGVAIVFVVVFNGARERAEYRADCFESAVGTGEYLDSGLSLREWCREQRLEDDAREAAMRDAYY